MALRMFGLSVGDLMQIARIEITKAKSDTKALMTGALIDFDQNVIGAYD